MGKYVVIICLCYRYKQIKTMKRLLFLLTLFVVLGMQAQQHVMTVDVSKPTARIGNPAMYGIFFEDISSVRTVVCMPNW